MKTFEIKNKEIFKKIEQNIKKRKEENEEYNDDLNRFDREIFIKKIESLGKDSDNLLFGSNPKYCPERDIRSHRKFIGPLLVKIRKLIYDEVRMSYEPVLYNQYKFNNSVLNVLQMLLKSNLVLDKSDNDKNIEEYLNKFFKKEKDVFVIGKLKNNYYNLNYIDLENKENRSLNGIILWNTIEKLSNKEIVDILNKSYLKLKKDKFLIINATNPGNLFNFSQEYYKNSFNPRILSPEVFKFILESLDFRDIKIKYYCSMKKLRKLRNDKKDNKIVNENFEILNKIFFSYKKYIIIAQK